MYNSEVYRNRGSFRFKNGKMLFIRFGSPNAQKQTHNRSSSDQKAPVNRGIWVFPYPFHDAFFYCHVFTRKLPKKFRNRAEKLKDMTEEEARAYNEEYDTTIKRVIERFRPSMIWYDGPLYSRISPHKGDPNRWTLYPNPKEWIEVARKNLLFCVFQGDQPRRYSDVIHRRYSFDHLEIFIPMHGDISARFVD